MPDYRIYLITEDNHIASAPVKISCENDLVAVQQSEKFLDRQDIQLWEGRQLVTRLKQSLLPDHSHERPAGLATPTLPIRF